ncbi:MAG: formate dehydrogenase subunit delta [Sphingomonadaceae bacterium]
MTTLDRLVRMANQIATNLASQSDDAARAVADHLALFWDPRMKAMIFAHLDAGGAGLSPVARDAVAQLRALSAEVQAGPADAG